MIEYSTRLEVNAIIERLVADGVTFPSEAAARLIELIPLTRSSRVSFVGRFAGFGSKFKGNAAGVGDVSMDDDRSEKTIRVNVEQSHKIGGYTLTHTPGSITIELMWAETKLDQSGLSCVVEYNPSTRQPIRMRIAAQKMLSFFWISLGYVTYVPWKMPDYRHDPE